MENNRLLTIDKIRKSAGTPLAASPTPLVKHEFRGREYMFIYYRTDREAVLGRPVTVYDYLK